MKRTLAEFEELTPAEEKLRDAVQRGAEARISANVPGEKTREVTIRASFIKYLALGGCESCRPTPSGVDVNGAWIDGDGDPDLPTRGLHLDGAQLCGDLYLTDCHIPDTIYAYGAQVKTLGLDRSHLLAGLRADRLQAEGNLFLRQAEITGTVHLSGARLGGDLSCVGAKLRAESGEDALFADRLQAEGSVFLRQAEVTGTVRLTGARLGGDLDCEGANLRAEGGAQALLADGLQAKGNFFLRNGAKIDGVLDLTGAEVGAINDDPNCWPAPHNLLLNRFRYGAITGGPVDAEARLRWLALLDPSRFGKDFWPQPYEQLAKVFREMGHAQDARRVLVEKEKLLRADQRRRLRAEGKNLRSGWNWVSDWVLWGVLAYGQKPLRALAWLLAFWLLGVGVFWFASNADHVKPNNSFVLRAPEWAACDPEYFKGFQALGAEAQAKAAVPRNADAAGDALYPSQLACFLDQPEAAGYPSFNPFIYSADTLLPIVDLEMQVNWIPDERHAPGARVFLWVQIIMGWALSLLAVAGFSGLVKSD